MDCVKVALGSRGMILEVSLPNAQVSQGEKNTHIRRIDHSVTVLNLVNYITISLLYNQII